MTPSSAAPISSSSPATSSTSAPSTRSRSCRRSRAAASEGRWHPRDRHRGQPRPQLLPRRRLLAPVPLLGQAADAAQSVRARRRARADAMESGGDARGVYRSGGRQAARLRAAVVRREHGANHGGLRGRAGRGARRWTREPGVEYRLLLMHTGVEGIVPQLHGLPTLDIRAAARPGGLRRAGPRPQAATRCDDWLYNPGSTETWGAEESAWERGYFVARWIPTCLTGSRRHTAQHLVNPRRPFLRFSFNVEGITTPAALYEHFERHCRERAARAPRRGGAASRWWTWPDAASSASTPPR